MIWTAAAVASGSSGLILSAHSYDAICLIRAVLVAIPVIVMLRYRMVLALAQRKTPRKP